MMNDLSRMPLPSSITNLQFSQKNISILSRVDVKPAYLNKKQTDLSKYIDLNKEKCNFAANDNQFKSLVVMGPSGAGKGTLIEKLKSKHGDKIGFSVSYATRDPREGEVEGVHYHFVTKAKFEEMIANDEFIEYMPVHSNYYGTSKECIEGI